MIKSSTSTSRPVPPGGHATDRSPTSETGQGVLESPSIDHHAGAGDAYLRLWELVNKLEKELRSAERKYPPDNSRIYALLELQIRIVSTLLPYERPKLKSVAPPEPRPCDLSKLTDEEMHELARLLTKITGEDWGAAEMAAPKPTRPDANHLATRCAGAPPQQDDQESTIDAANEAMMRRMRERRRMREMRRMGS
jgi:hypothetical protein